MGKTLTLVIDGQPTELSLAEAKGLQSTISTLFDDQSEGKPVLIEEQHYEHQGDTNLWRVIFEQSGVLISNELDDPLSLESEC